MDQNFVERIQKKLAEELVKKEREFLEYWEAELQRILGRRHQDRASLENDLRELLTRMETRRRNL